ncbi:MAG: hypothetical protein M0Q22_14700 [Sulfuritalea sp.]|jgi:hypothetical protein|nr:hypothetical protein [Sulfuritalea sp.]
MANTAFKRIVKVLLESPGLTRSQIAERAFVGKTTLSGGGYLKTMKESGLIHISGWLRNPSGRFSTPLYSAGGGEDCVRPKATVQNREAPGMVRLLDAIRDYGPIDYRQAAMIAELSLNTVKNAGYLESLVSQRKIHIAEWRRSRNGPMRPVYEVGRGKEAPRPHVLTGAERSRRHRMHAMYSTGGLVLQIKAVIMSYPELGTTDGRDRHRQHPIADAD